MHTTPIGWDEARNGTYRMETRLRVDSTTYHESDIVSVSTRASLFRSGTVSIGGCVAKEIDLKIIPKSDIPRMARIDVYTRPISEEREQWPSWLQKGEYYIDTREVDNVTGVMTIHGYDAMLKAEQLFLVDGSTTDDWPRSMSTVADEIARRMGVTIDDRTTVSDTYMVEYPNDLTMREILGYIAAAHAGNWVITDIGELRLIGIADIPPETNYLVSDCGDVITFGDTRILI